MKTYFIKRWFNVQVTKIKHVGMLISIVLLALNLSLTVYSFIKWRGIHPYLGTTLLFFVIMFLILAFSHIWMNKWHMYAPQKMAEAILYNPYAVFAYTPFQEMWFSHIYIPIMEALYDTIQDEEKKKKFKKSLELVKKWTKLGYIPKEDFPEHLKKYYIFDEGMRL